MKVLFTNPPFVRHPSSNAKNNYKIPGLPYHKLYSKYPLLYKFWNSFRDNEVRYGVRAGSRWPWTSENPLKPLHYPFMMAYSVSYLNKKGVKADLYDAIGEEEYSYSNYLKKLKKHRADIIFIETSATSFDIDIWIAEKIAGFTDVGITGPHITHSAEAINKNYPFIKYLLKGESIISSYKAVKSQKAGIYEPDIVKDFDSIPYPYRDFPAATKYFDFTMPTPAPQLQIYGSKGCPFKCSFCVWPQLIYMETTSYRKPENIIKEIKHCINIYGYKSIFFDDDTFNIGTKRISDLCDGLKKLNVPWTMMGRLDCSPLWLYDKMIDSGCIGMRFGVESFDPKVQKAIGKGLERSKYVKTIKYLSDKYPKLMIRLFMMKNLPAQSKKSHQEDMDFLYKLGYEENGNKYRQIQLSSCAPFPGTRLFKQINNQMSKKDINRPENYDGYMTTIMKSVTA